MYNALLSINQSRESCEFVNAYLSNRLDLQITELLCYIVR